MDDDEEDQQFSAGPRMAFVPAAGKAKRRAFSVERFHLYTPESWPRVVWSMARRLHQVNASPQQVQVAVATWFATFAKGLPRGVEVADIRASVEKRLDDLQNGTDDNAFERAIVLANGWFKAWSAGSDSVLDQFADSPKTLRLALVCKALATISKAPPKFFISVRQAAEIVSAITPSGEPEQRTGHRKLDGLVTQKVIKPVPGRKGNSKHWKATEFEYIASRIESVSDDDNTFGDIPF